MAIGQSSDFFSQLTPITTPEVARSKSMGSGWDMNLLSQTGGSTDPYTHQAFPLAAEITRQIEKLKKELETFKETLAKVLERPNVVPSKIYALPGETYQLSHPLDVIIKIHVDEVIAVFPELELYGEGENEMEAIEDLKNELIDLYEELTDTSDEALGDRPKEWKRILKVFINKCV